MTSVTAPSTEHSDLSCSIKDEAFGNTCIITCLTCLSLLHHILQQRFLALNSATSNLLVTSFRPNLDPLHCQSLRMFQVVVEKVLTLMPPTTKSASLGFITWQAKIDNLTTSTYHEVSVICKLKVLRNALSSRIHASNY